MASAPPSVSELPLTRATAATRDGVIHKARWNSLQSFCEAIALASASTTL